LHIWLQALYILSISDAPLSVQEFARVLGVSVKTATTMRRFLEGLLADGLVDSVDA
jgi:Mn-dependent DtxR family transcriptional regulator